MGEKAEYRFDEVRLSSPSLSAEEPSKLMEYTYDALGRRVAVTDYVGASAYTTRYLYAGNRIIEELDGDNNLQASYVYGLYVDEVLQMRRDTDEGTAGMEDHYYLHDDQFNVIALTDAAGEVVERYEYGDFGDPTIYDAAGVEREDKTSAFGNVYMFQGRPYDAETGLYFYRTRYLDPVQGRFISRDTIGVWGDPVSLGNPYSFGGNSPWTNRDPYGEGVIGWMLAGDYNVSDAMIIGEGLKGAGQGAAVVADTTMDTLSLGATGRVFEDSGVYSDNDAGIRGSKILSRVGVEAGLMAATMGTGNAAINGVRGASAAHKGFVAYDTAGGALSVAQGIGQVANGEYLAGTLNILGGGFRAGGAAADARRVAGASSSVVSPIRQNPWKKTEYNGQRVYQRDDLIDPSTVSSWTVKRKVVNGTNLERMASGRAPIGRDGFPVNLHHLIQDQHGAIAEVAQSFHQKHYATIHINTGDLPSGINRSAFDTWRGNYWKSRAKSF